MVLGHTVGLVSEGMEPAAQFLMPTQLGGASRRLAGVPNQAQLFAGELLHLALR